MSLQEGGVQAPFGAGGLCPNCWTLEEPLSPPGHDWEPKNWSQGGCSPSWATPQGDGLRHPRAAHSAWLLLAPQKLSRVLRLGKGRGGRREGNLQSPAPSLHPEPSTKPAPSSSVRRHWARWGRGRKVGGSWQELWVRVGGWRVSLLPHLPARHPLPLPDSWAEHPVAAC